MRFFSRGSAPAALPAEAVEVLKLEAKDRPLAWSALVGGGWAVATAAGFRAVLPTGARIARPWVEVDHVAWEPDAKMLAIWWIGTRQATPIEVDTPGHLPEVVHERVRSSVVLTHEVEVPGGVVRVVLRKAADGELSVQTLPGSGVRLTDPAVAAAVSRARALVNDDAGLPLGR